mgnify:CR=1 FL=1
MKILYAYDTSGNIIYTGQTEPAGIPCMWIDVPQGKRVARIDTSTTPHTPIYKTDEIAGLQARVGELEDIAKDLEHKYLLALDAVATVYEQVLPFLPQ